VPKIYVGLQCVSPYAAFCFPMQAASFIQQLGALWFVFGGPQNLPAGPHSGSKVQELFLLA
jgi:hypothetical protein